MDKSQLEAELLQVQKQKVEAEIAILKRTTPVTEGIKIMGSFVVGLGGAIVVIFGFQMAEVKAEKSKLEAERAIQTKNAADQELVVIKETSDVLKKKNDSLTLILAKSISDIEQFADKAKQAKVLPRTQSNEALVTLQKDANAAAVDLRASTPSLKSTNHPAQPLSTVIEALFAPKAGVRGAAYSQLMTYYTADPALIPSLIDYANEHLANENGIYNTLVVLGHLDYSKVPKQVIGSVQTFAEQTRNNGPKSAERAKKIIERLPKF